MYSCINSFFRYYLNQFRDAYRQATIDLMTGQPVSEELLKAVAKEEDEDGEFDKVIFPLKFKLEKKPNSIDGQATKREDI
jgi:hypothetical protein